MSIIRRDITLAIVIIVFSIVGFITSNNFADDANIYGPAFFPRIVFILLGVFSILMIIESILKRKAQAEKFKWSKGIFLKSLLLILTIFIYILLFNYIGFLISSILFLVASQLIFNVKNKIVLLAVSILLPILLYFIFSIFFNIPIP